MDMSIIFVGAVLLILSITNVFSLLFDKQKLAGIAKVFLIPLVILLCYLINPNMNIIIYIGLVFGWLGDIFLLSDKKHMFLFGLSSFLIGHVLYMIVMAGELSFPDMFIAIPVAVLILVLVVFVYKSLKKHAPRDMNIALVAYLLCLAGINFLSINILSQAVTMNSILLAMGSALFFVSDYVLARGMFVEKNSLGDFIVMSTYIPAQLLIGLSFALN